MSETVDDFERDSLEHYSGDTSKYTTAEDWSSNGSRALAWDVSSAGTPRDRIRSTAGLPKYPERGTVLEWDVKLESLQKSQYTNICHALDIACDGSRDSYIRFRHQYDPNTGPNSPSNTALLLKVVNDGTVVASNKVGIREFSEGETISYELDYGDPTITVTVRNSSGVISSIEIDAPDAPESGGIAWEHEAGDRTTSQTIYVDNLRSRSRDPPDGDVTASVTTLQFIPGEEENVEKDGDPLNSALMHVFDEDDSVDVPFAGEFNLHPVLDSWYYGDMKDEIAETLKEATDAERGKYLDAFGEDPYRNYRFKHEIDVSFDTTDGGVDLETVDITFNGPLQRDIDTITSTDKETSSYSVLVDNEVNLLPIDDWFGGDKKRRANQEPQYYTYEEDFELDGTEGVRVLSISGGYVGFADRITEKSSNDLDEFLTEIFDWDGRLEELAAGAAGVISASERLSTLLEIIQVVPRTWSFIEFIVLADGRRYTRVWDASQYPSLFTYMDGERMSQDRMPYQPQERANPWLLAFFARAMVDGTPYQGSFSEYIDIITDSDIIDIELEDEYRRMINIFEPDYDVAASEVLPHIPRETLGYNPTDGPDVESPSAPFGETPDLSETTEFRGSDFQELGPDQ